MKQKGSSDVKGSLWNHLDKKGSYGIVKMNEKENSVILLKDVGKTVADSHRLPKYFIQ